MGPAKSHQECTLATKKKNLSACLGPATYDSQLQPSQTPVKIEPSTSLCTLLALLAEPPADKRTPFELFFFVLSGVSFFRFYWVRLRVYKGRSGVKLDIYVFVVQLSPNKQTDGQTDKQTKPNQTKPNRNKQTNNMKMSVYEYCISVRQNKNKMLSL